MKILYSCVGRRSYIIDYFKEDAQDELITIGTSHTEFTPAFHSCDINYLVPPIKDKGYVQSLLDLCSKIKPNAILSFFDQDIDRLSNHLNDFRELQVVPIISSKRVSDVSFDKYETVKFLKNNDFRSPITFIDLKKAESAIESGELDYPLFVKPRFGFASKNIFIANNLEQLRLFYHYDNDMLIQEFLSGEEYSFDILNNLEGDVISVIVKKKLAMRAGETDQAITVKSDAMLDFGTKLGQALGHVGPLDVDFFWDGRNITVLELNPRFGGGYPSSHIAGANFPGKIMRLIKGEKLVPDIGDYQEGVIMMKQYSILKGMPPYE